MSHPQLSLLVTSDLLAQVRGGSGSRGRRYLMALLCLSLPMWEPHGALLSMQELLWGWRTWAWPSAWAWVLPPQGTFWSWDVPSCPVARAGLAGGCPWPRCSKAAAGTPCPSQLGRCDRSQSCCSRMVTQAGGYLFQ